MEIGHLHACRFHSTLDRLLCVESNCWIPAKDDTSERRAEPWFMLHITGNYLSRFSTRFNALTLFFLNRHFEWASEMRLASWRTQITRQSSAIRPIGSDTRKVFSPSSVRGERVTTSRAWTNHQLELTQSNQAENLENESRIWELPTADNVSVSNNYGRHSCLNN